MSVLGVVSQYPRVADEIYDRLRGAILAKDLPAGTRLSVPSLAEQLGVSRSPVREAVQRLVQDGLASEEPRRGAEVARLDPDDAAQLYEVREVLEGLTARLACERATPDELAALEAILAEHRHAVAVGDLQRHIELDMLFHKGLRNAARNAELTASLERVQGRIAIAMLAADTTWYRHALEEHEAIMRAVQGDSPAEAEAAAIAHIARVRRDLQNRGSAS